MEPWGAVLYGDPCRECGFAWSMTAHDAVAWVAGFDEVVKKTTGSVTGRERFGGWSIAAYVAHVGDNLRQWAERVQAARLAGETNVPGYDQDALAHARNYELIPLEVARWSVSHEAARWCEVMTAALAEGVEVQHATRGAQRAEDIARNNCHDAHHHLWDIQRIATLGTVPQDPSDVQVALLAAAAGAEEIKRRYGADLSHVTKSPTDFSTEADLAAETAIRRVIAAARSDDTFEGEETGTSVGPSGRRWLVDPLCGTLNFAATTPLASVNIALRTPLGVVAAVAADPIADEIFWTDGDGAWVRHRGVDRPLVPSPKSLIVDVNCDAKRDTTFLGAQLIADKAFRDAFAPRVLSSTLAVAWVAAGRRAAYVTDGNLDGSVHFAAGIALCQAAGCVVTDFAGDPVHTGRGLIAAADEPTHSRLLELVGSNLARLVAQ